MADADESARVTRPGRAVSVNARWRSPLKTATYHGIVLRRDGHRWVAEVVLDV